MNIVEQAIDNLYEALSTVPDLHIARGVGVRLDPPAAVVAPPALRWDAYSDDPVNATFTVPVVVRQDESAVPELMKWVPLVVSALREADNATVGSAEPGLWAGGGTELPAYLIQVDVSLM